MKMNGALTQVKAFARVDALYMLLLWTVSFLCTALWSQSGLGNIMSLCTPLVAGWLLIRFRNSVLDGSISFRRGFAYTTYLFAYAALLFAIVQYLYFRFIDMTFVLRMFTMQFNLLEPGYKAQGFTDHELALARSAITDLTPMVLTMLFLFYHLVIGVLVAVPVSLVGMRKPDRRHPTHNT